MVDITKCNNNQQCPLREKCYRAVASASPYQSYQVFEPVGDKCKFFVAYVADTRKADKPETWEMKPGKSKWRSFWDSFKIGNKGTIKIMGVTVWRSRWHEKKGQK